MLTAKLTSDTDLSREVPLDDDWLAFTFVDAKILDFELELYATKWFDYRHMTGVQATKAYIDAYAPIYRDIYAREVDYERAEHVRPVDYDKLMGKLREGDPKTKTKYKGFWRGRQVADALGMPYEIYIERAFTYRLRAWKQRYLPQPWHLFHEFDVEKIQSHWIELQETSLYLSDHPAYNVQHYQGAAHQNDYHEWLFRQAMHRSSPATMLARFVDNHQLTLEKIEQRMPPEIYQQVEELIS